MKYPKELYIESGFYGGDEEIEKYTEKVVKCRKSHKCSGCQNEIQAGEEAVSESGFMDGHPVSNYICLPCIEAWLEESGQVEVADAIKQKLTTDAMDYLNQNMKQPFVEKGGEWSDI